MIKAGKPITASTGERHAPSADRFFRFSTPHLCAPSGALFLWRSRRRCRAAVYSSDARFRRRRRSRRRASRRPGSIAMPMARSSSTGCSIGGTCSGANRQAATQPASATTISVISTASTRQRPAGGAPRRPLSVVPLDQRGPEAARRQHCGGSGRRRGGLSRWRTPGLGAAGGGLAGGRGSSAGNGPAGVGRARCRGFGRHRSARTARLGADARLGSGCGVGCRHRARRRRDRRRRRHARGRGAARRPPASRPAAAPARRPPSVRQPGPASRPGACAAPVLCGSAAAPEPRRASAAAPATWP